MSRPYTKGFCDKLLPTAYSGLLGGGPALAVAPQKVPARALREIVVCGAGWWAIAEGRGRVG
jgi:hypothetical protein